MLLNPMV